MRFGDADCERIGALGAWRRGLSIDGRAEPVGVLICGTERRFGGMELSLGGAMDILGEYEAYYEDNTEVRAADCY